MLESDPLFIKSCMHNIPGGGDPRDPILKHPYTTHGEYISQIPYSVLANNAQIAEQIYASLVAPYAPHNKIPASPFFMTKAERQVLNNAALMVADELYRQFNPANLEAALGKVPAPLHHFMPELFSNPQASVIVDLMFDQNTGRYVVVEAQAAWPQLYPEMFYLSQIYRELYNIDLTDQVFAPSLNNFVDIVTGTTDPREVAVIKYNHTSEKSSNTAGALISKMVEEQTGYGPNVLTYDDINIDSDQYIVAPNGQVIRRAYAFILWDNYLRFNREDLAGVNFKLNQPTQTEIFPNPAGFYVINKGTLSNIANQHILPQIPLDESILALIDSNQIDLANFYLKGINGRRNEQNIKSPTRENVIQALQSGEVYILQPIIAAPSVNVHNIPMVPEFRVLVHRLPSGELTVLSNMVKLYPEGIPHSGVVYEGELQALTGEHPVVEI